MYAEGVTRDGTTISDSGPTNMVAPAADDFSSKQMKIENFSVLSQSQSQARVVPKSTPLTLHQQESAREQSSDRLLPSESLFEFRFPKNSKP
ncbi:hypothetical protein L2E82_25761 [Cichorium intybus]|uniref:Uncharacterized protein n=1 Tax=Cichorium intybus TaxID=13427 RepID=A0ACB9E4T6_CICIN|nr:hypothetical protein L2E82_25761 [Cichorium intybus]